VLVYTVFLTMLLRGRPQRPLSSRSLGDGTVSLVIPTHNEAEVIERKLDNTLQLDFPRSRLKVIVVDSGSTDGTKEIVRKFAGAYGERMKIELLEQPTRRGKGQAINEALRLVDSDILALTDADVTLQPQALSRLVSDIEKDGVGAASGVEIPVETNGLIGRVERDYRTVYTAIRIAEAEIDTPFMCESEFSAYRRNLVQPLQEGCMCDDVELTVGIRSKGVRAVYDAEAPFLETEADSFNGKLRHKLRRGMANQHALLRNRTVLFNRVFGKYGTIIFPFEFFVHIVSPILVTAALLVLLLLLLSSPTSALIALLVATLSALPSLAIVRGLVRRHVENRDHTLPLGKDWMLGAIAFLGFQTTLAYSLLRLLVKGPQLNWSKISGTRNSTKPTISNGDASNLRTAPESLTSLA
jgi:cellulose synthase/poly-beta-1,6-N-acetylglucosamine synthase-like glycosyltransferase